MTIRDETDTARKRPRSRRSGPAALAGVAATLLCATVGAVAGAVAGWHTAADLPDDATADRIARLAIPGMGDQASGHRHLFAWEDMQGRVQSEVFAFTGGDEHDAGHLAYRLEHPADDHGRLREAHERLAAAGWQVTPVRAHGSSAELTGVQGGLTLEVSTAADSSGPSLTSVYIYRNTPVSVPVLTVAGLLVGGLAGWIVSGRLTRRGAAAVPFGVGSVLLAPPTVFNLYSVGESLVHTDERVAVWLGYTWGPAATMTLLGVAALGVALLPGDMLMMMRRVSRTAR